MTLGDNIFQALGLLVGNRVYPDVAPPNPVLPYVTYQRVGGDPVNFLDGAQPSKANARMQINVWAATRSQASALAQLVETAMRGDTGMQVTVSTQPVDRYDEATRRCGTMQFFSCWSDVS